MASKTLTDLFHDQLQDAYSAEYQISKALPKMAKAATDPQLKAGFEQHLAETENQLKRLQTACDQCGIKPTANTCEATKGLVEEGEETMSLGLEPAALDAGLIIAGQKVEHYEIALYGGLCALAKELGHTDIAAELHKSLAEEKATDEKLTMLAEAGLNRRAKQTAKA